MEFTTCRRSPACNYRPLPQSVYATRHRPGAPPAGVPPAWYPLRASLPPPNYASAISGTVPGQQAIHFTVSPVSTVCPSTESVQEQYAAASCLVVATCLLLTVSSLPRLSPNLQLRLLNSTANTNPENAINRRIKICYSNPQTTQSASARPERILIVAENLLALRKD